MPRVHLNSITPTDDGVLVPAPVSGDATNDHTVTNTGRTIILVENTGVTLRNVGVEFERTVQGQTVPALNRPIAAGQRWAFGAFEPSDYGQLLKVNVDHADLKVTVIEP